MSLLELAGRRLSVAMTTDLAARLAAHLDREDGQEDLCFVLWNPSRGATRTTALLTEAIWPREGERLVHGNVSFTSPYFLRAADRAAEAGSGLALIHSHPGGRSWQGLSGDDHDAEGGHAAQTTVLTGLPLVGLTYATGDGTYSARFWRRSAPRVYQPQWCESVRLVGDRIRVFWNPALRPAPAAGRSQIRTVSAWGVSAQVDLARLHVGVIGAGSVGAQVAESLARIGVEQITLMDFDSIKEHNLDRLLHAGPRDVRLARSKVEVLARGLRRSSTAIRPRITPRESSVVEPDGFARALDCDVLFSCVDRPWPRAVLNLAAYAHLVPVVDGGIRVRSRRGQRLLGAEWRAHLAAPGRACLECLGQYDPGMVGVERAGLLDDPVYIAGLAEDHPLRRNENVFPFSAAAAAAEVLQLLTAVIEPCGIGDVGAHLYHFTTGTLDRIIIGCKPTCPYTTTLLSTGDTHGLTVTGKHSFAEAERDERVRGGRGLLIRFERKIDDALWRRL